MYIQENQLIIHSYYNTVLKKTTDIYLLSLNTKRMMYLFLYVYIYVYSYVQDKIILARGY